jgi:hypothetical protein
MINDYRLVMALQDSFHSDGNQQHGRKAQPMGLLHITACLTLSILHCCTAAVQHHHHFHAANTSCCVMCAAQ